MIDQNDSVLLTHLIFFTFFSVCIEERLDAKVYLAAGDFFSEECFFLGSPNHHKVVAFSDCKILQMDGRKGGFFQHFFFFFFFF